MPRFSLLDGSQEFGVFRLSIVRKPQISDDMLQTEKPVKLLLLASPHQVAKGTDRTAKPSMPRRSLSIYHKQQVNRLALRMQLPSHLIGKQSPIAISSKLVWALRLNFTQHL